MTSSHNMDETMRIPQFRDSDQLQSDELGTILDNLEGIENNFSLSIQRINDAFKLLRKKMEDEVIVDSTVQVVESSPYSMVLEDSIKPTTSSKTECSPDGIVLEETKERCKRDNQRRENMESGKMNIQKLTKVERREIEEKIVQLEQMMDEFDQILNAFQQTIEKEH